MSKIACGVIAYNAEDKLPALLKSLKGHIDYLVLGIDKKTTDKTRQVAEEWAKKSKVPLIVHDFLLEDSEDEPNGPKNFDRARNENWALFPKDAEWGFWIDTDDVLHADVSLHQIADEQPEDVSQVWLQYSYFRDSHGNVTTYFWRERLIRLRVPGKWIRRLHEICISSTGRHVRDERAWVEHENRTDESSKGERNFSTLHAILKDNPNDQWAILYLGLQYFGATEYDKAAEQFLKFVPMCEDIGERWQAYVYASKAFRLGRRFAESEQSALAALREYPVWADPYYEMSAACAEIAVNTRDDKVRRIYAQKSIQWYEEGVKHPPLDDPRLLKNPLDYDYNPAATVQVCYQILGQLNTAKDLLEKAIAIAPDPRLIEVRDQYQKVLAKQEAISQGLNLAGYLYTSGEPLKAREILRALPVGSDQETRNVTQVRATVAHGLQFADSDNAYENRYFLEAETQDPDPSNPTQEERWLLESLKRAGAKRVLDFGVGNGQTALYLAQNGIKVVGVDVDPRRVKAANFAAVKAGFLQKKYSSTAGRSVPVLEKRGKPIPGLMVQFWYGATDRVSEKARSLGPFDAVLLDNLLNRVRDVEATIRTAEGLAPRVLITVPDGASLNYQPKSATIRRFDRIELEEMFLERGVIIDSHGLGDLLTLHYATGTPPHRSGASSPAVVIFCGPGWEEWTPDQINGRGLGGSETAVVHLAEEMVKRGLRVMVYAEAEGTWNGVHYRKYSKFTPQMPVWMFIAWRSPVVFDAPIQADLKYLWLHDVDCGDSLTKERLEKIDSILVLSKWHRDHMRQKYALDVDRLTIIGNGIVPERFDEDFFLQKPIAIGPDSLTTERARESRAIYSSSADRGLEQALTYWPEIRKRTGAELHVFYGWENFDLMGGPKDFKKKIMDLAKQDGVVWCGRVPQDELAKEMMKAKVLFYPGPHPFDETFCITALEAQAAGCVPVTRDNGALPETNKHGIVLPNDSKPKRWFAAVQEALSTPESDRSKMREWALGQTWEAVANRVVTRSIEIDALRQQQESTSA